MKKRRTDEEKLQEAMNLCKLIMNRGPIGSKKIHELVKLPRHRVRTALAFLLDSKYIKKVPSLYDMRMSSYAITNRGLLNVND